jgi:hypothetical protein
LVPPDTTQYQDGSLHTNLTQQNALFQYRHTDVIHLRVEVFGDFRQAMPVGVGFHHDHDFRRSDFLSDGLQVAAQLRQVYFYERGTYPEVGGDGRMVDGHGGILLHHIPVIFHIRFGFGRRADTEFDSAKAILLVESPTSGIDLERIQPEMFRR